MSERAKLGAMMRTMASLRDWAGARRRKETTMRMRAEEERRLVMAKSIVEREERKGRLTAYHGHVMLVAAHHLDVAPDTVEEGVLDADTHMDLLDSFLSAGGCSIILFGTMDMASLPTESGRIAPSFGEGARRVVVWDGSSMEVRGSVVVAVLKVNNSVSVDAKNIAEDIFFQQFNLEEGDNCLTIVETVTGSVTKPRLKINTDWGILTQTASGPRVKEDFLKKFASFLVFLRATKTNLKDVVVLELSDMLLRTYLTRPPRILLALSMPAVVKEVNETVQKWHNRITYTLSRTALMPRDYPAETGPHEELCHWRHVAAVLSSLVENIRGPKCKAYIRFLVFSKSRLFHKWKLLDNRVTDAHNRARDNLKFLYSLEKLYKPLYGSDPVEIRKCIPALVFGIRMVYSTSVYYNNREMSTSFFTKVMARMVTACRDYIAKDGEIWKQAKSEVIRKINECLQLYQKYRECYRDTKRQMAESPHEKPFECSEAFIFSAFVNFKQRLEKIADVLSIILDYSLLNTCAIEDMERHAAKFTRLYLRIAGKKYNPLEYLEPDFDADYEHFKRDVDDIEAELQSFLLSCLQKEQDVVNKLRLLQRFENLRLPCFKTRDMYPSIVEEYEREIARWRDFYDEYCTQPHVHSMPPICGRIYWARATFRRIEEPMEMLKGKAGVLDDPSSWRAVNMYNALLKSLVYYELSFHRQWFSSVRAVGDELNQPVLVWNEEIRRHEINLDPSLAEVVMETENMWDLDLEVPEAAAVLALRKERVVAVSEQLRVILQRDAALRSNIDHLFLPLLRPLLYKLQRALMPGLHIITWTSYHLRKFCEDVEQTLTQCEIFIKQVNDIKEYRIDRILQEVTGTVMVSLPADDEIISASEFADRNVVLSREVGLAMEERSLSAESSAVELVDRLLTLVDSPEMQDRLRSWREGEFVMREKKAFPRDAGFRLVEDVTEKDVPAIIQECKELYHTYMVHMINSLTAATFNSLNLLSRQTDIHSQVAPLFTTDIVLKMQVIVLEPTLDHMQKMFDSVFGNVLNTLMYVHVWGQDRPSSGHDSLVILRNYYKPVTDQTEVSALTHVLRRVINQLEPHVNNIMQDFFKKYSQLWAPDRAEKVHNFVNSEPPPDFGHINEAYAKYDRYIEEINNITAHFDIGAIRMLTDKLKTAMLEECEQWKVLLGEELHRFYNVKLMAFLEHVAGKTSVVQRRVVDLESVRVVMECLQQINEEFYDNADTVDLLEEMYATLQRFGVQIPLEEAERLDTLRMQFDNLTGQAKASLNGLMEVYEPFREELLASVKQFKADLSQFDADFQERGPMEAGIPPHEASDRVVIFKARFDELQASFETYSSGERLFDMEVQEYPVLEERRRQLRLLGWLYDLYNSVMATVSGYYELLWSEVDIEAITAQLQDFQMRCRQLPVAMRDWPAFIDLRKKIDDFNEMVPLLRLMLDESMQERHWNRLSEAMNYRFHVERETFSLREVMEAPLLQFSAEVEDICVGAVREKDIESRLSAVKAEWLRTELQFAPFKNRGDLLLKGLELSEIMTSLEESLMILSSLFANRYNVFYKSEIQEWMNKLDGTFEVLETWIQVQNLWVYLEAVFVAGDIARQLPAEARRFANIDRMWVDIMRRAWEKPNVVECAVGDDTMRNLLPHLLQQLEECQKSLTGYLESKRLIFPRFFFVSDPVLLEILGQASDPHTIQPHLLSVFDNVARAEFHPTMREHIIAVFSREKERIPLVREVVCTGGVELWLGELLEVKKQTLCAIIADAAHHLDEPQFEILEMLAYFPAQVGLVSLQSMWTRDSEIALNKARADRDIMRATNRYFLDLLNLFIEQTVRELSRFDRTKYETIVTIHLHQRDIFDDLFRQRIRSVRNFEWLKQARFYFNDDTDELTVSITDVDFVYQNEYLGCTERLVITPLTDRCYITLAQALGMSMGGAPAGPAGTGKTETVKDMGKALGKYVVVFNCSDQMDFRGLGRIFKGLAQSGTWGCFDEFNRINLPVLSVAAQQISIVLTAKKERKRTFIFLDGDEVTLDPEFGIFLTMNPGYAGRQELPENLKVQFRTVAMMVPDRQIIIRVKLASCGFKDNITLARKFYVLYSLCEGQLSKQVHYDFGLRNILSVLRTLGAQKRANPLDTEDMTVMRVLYEMNLSKLVDEDEPLFKSLINDLFPGMTVGVTEHEGLQDAISKDVTDRELINHPPWNLKIVQFYETNLVRHGLMALGPTGAGKTTMIHTLMATLTDMGHPHREMRMNPKAITAPQMFGTLDVATNDWTDGIFSTLWRRTHRVKSTEFIWLVLDGPVDAVWIENLNSVLDDNKTLTLANGDRIPMAPNCKLLFEPDNVDNASPATVSRMGMVFISSSTLTWEPLLKGWLRHRREQEANILMSFFQKLYWDLKEFVHIRLVAKMASLGAIYIRQCTSVLEGVIDILNIPTVLSENHLERLFLFSLMWSLGALLELDDREKFQDYVLNHKSKLDWPPIRENETVFEYVVNDDGKWQHWSEFVDKYIYPVDHIPDYLSILVPNVDNVRTSYLIHVIANKSKPVLLIGEQGTAKTVMIKGYMAGYNAEEHIHKTLNFSSATTPNMFQRIIESYVDRRAGTTHGPPAGKKMTVFIDDINMPVVNEWGDQITNEIVRQLIETYGFYSLDRPGDFITIEDMQFVAAMIHPGGGRNDIPSRLKRHFTTFNCTIPSNTSVDFIFSCIGEGYFCRERFKEKIVDFVPKLVPLTRVVWQRTKVRMLPTPAKFHYVFNLRDLSRIWQGMLYIHDEELPDINTLLKLWVHECTRVISDRFTTFDDRDWFLSNMSQTAEEKLGPDFIHYPKEEAYFVDFLRDPPEATGEEEEEMAVEAPKIYEEIPSFEFLINVLKQQMMNYNESVRTRQMDLVFFCDAVVHIIKISRVLRLPQGNILLVGVGGSGKQSLTRLASFIAGYETFQITLTRTYGESELMEDLKVIYNAAGMRGRGVTFIFTDNEIKDEGFLEYINNILGTGEIAGLFSREEFDEISTALTPIMRREQPRRPVTPDSLYEFFIERSRANLHVALCFSPIGEKFRSRALKFPGLISGCTMDWFMKWPIDALVAVSKHFLDDFLIVSTPEAKTELIKLMGDVQEDVSEVCERYFERYRRQTFVTPKSFLSFLEGYKTIYSDRYKTISGNAERMQMGLEKLVEAQENVDELKTELEEMEKEIQVAVEETTIILARVTISAREAEEVKSEVSMQANQAQVIVDQISKDKAVADEMLKKAMPALLAAERAADTIKPLDIATVRRLTRPAPLAQIILDAVLIFFQRKLHPVTPYEIKKFITPSWPEALKLLADARFLFNLREYSSWRMNDEMVDLLRPYFEFEEYTVPYAMAVSASIAGLLSWTRAMVDYYNMSKLVRPLQENVDRQMAILREAEVQLQKARDLLAEKEAEVAATQAEYDKAKAQEQEVLARAQDCQDRMDAATALLDGLASERVRWTEQSAGFKLEIDCLIGDVLLLTGFLSYTGPYNQAFRDQLLASWARRVAHSDIPMSTKVNIIESLVDSATIGEWNLQELPNDELSIQNGIIVTKASRFPLLIDPQGQGKLWIRNKERYFDLQVTNLQHRFFRNHLEDSVPIGRPLLIEDVGEELDPVLDNLLEKNFVKVGTMYKVMIGDKEVDVHNDFRLYITTKLANPTYTPEVFARTSIIDFTVTMKGLEDQLLGRVILAERKELEAERTALIAGITANKRQMQQLEADLLHKLSTVEGSLLDDKSVIDVLNITKTTAMEVQEKLKVAAATEIQINTAREEFRPIATRGSVLYFVIVEMSMVNNMYQTSLVQFLERFDLSLERSEKTIVVQIRIQNIIDYLTFEVFRYKCQGLYEEHKYLYTLLMALKIDMQRNKITHQEFQYFIIGGAALDLATAPQKPFRWISDVTWLNLVQLQTFPSFHKIIEHLTRGERQWRAWYDNEAPEEATIPDGYSASVDVFRQLMLIRAWSTDRILFQARKYVASTLGARFNEAVITDYDRMVEESRPATPMICFLSMGSDPTGDIMDLARRLEISCSAISMGQGQEIHSRLLLSHCMAEGGWVLLQNAHLGLDYMDELFDTLTEAPTLHQDLRVWITTEPHPNFSISLLQICIKFTNDPPQGMRAGLRRTYSVLTDSFLEYSSLPAYLPLVYTTSFLHSVVQERRKFGPLGWNIPYEFNSSDWLASCLFIQNHLDDTIRTGLSWTTIRYMVSEVQYGGRVTDDYDKRLLVTITRMWYCDPMLGGDFQFYDGYKMMLFRTVDDYLAGIDQLPDIDPPQVYGLHPNADITYQSNTTKAILDKILSVQPREAASGTGETRESVVNRQAEDMLSKLPPLYDPFEVRDRLKAMNHLLPMNIFLRQEIERMGRVIKLVGDTLRDLMLAIEGTIIMNEQLRDALDNIFNARVPKFWEWVSWESSTIGFWYTELLSRSAQFSTWIFTGRPYAFWMTGFFNPQGFLTAMRQETARDKNWSLDTVALQNTLTRLNREDIRSPPKEGVYVYGLFLDGAAWDRRHDRLVESTPKILFVALPVVNIFAVSCIAPPNPKLYMCPVYTKPKRTDLTYITSLFLPTEESPDHWILRGVAILCDTK